MRLLRAELTKLRRPLTWCGPIVAVLTSLTFAWQGVRNADTSRTERLAQQRPRPVTYLNDSAAAGGGPVRPGCRVVQEQIDAFRIQQAALQPPTPATTPIPPTPYPSNSPSPPGSGGRLHGIPPRGIPDPAPRRRPRSQRMERPHNESGADPGRPTLAGHRRETGQPVRSVAMEFFAVDWVALALIEPDPQGRLPARRGMPGAVVVGGVDGGGGRRSPGAARSSSILHRARGLTGAVPDPGTPSAPSLPPSGSSERRFLAGANAWPPWPRWTITWWVSGPCTCNSAHTAMWCTTTGADHCPGNAWLTGVCRRHPRHYRLDRGARRRRGAPSFAGWIFAAEPGRLALGPSRSSRLRPRVGYQPGRSVRIGRCSRQRPHRGSCHRVLVLYKGRLVEHGSTQEVLRHPEEEYNEAWPGARAPPPKSRVPPDQTRGLASGVGVLLHHLRSSGETANRLLMP